MGYVGIEYIGIYGQMSSIERIIKEMRAEGCEVMGEGYKVRDVEGTLTFLGFELLG